MHVRWSPEAVNDLTGIVVYILQDNPTAAREVAAGVYEWAATTLTRFPYSGRPGRVEGTREFPLPPPLPFIVVYRVREDAIEISNILHGAQKCPPA